MTAVRTESLSRHSGEAAGSPSHCRFSPFPTDPPVTNVTDGAAVRVTDYQSGAPPKNPDAIVIAGGAELQRALYALAARQLLPGVRRIDAHLVYLNDETRKFSLRDPDDALAWISHLVAAAADLLRVGTALPGRDAYERYHDLRLAFGALQEDLSEGRPERLTYFLFYLLALDG